MKLKPTGDLWLKWRYKLKMFMLLNIVMERLEMLQKQLILKRLSKFSKLMKNRQAAKMELTTIVFNQNSQFFKDNSIAQNLYFLRIMRFKKPCKCIKNSINGTKQSNVPRKRDIQMSKI